MTPMFGNWTSEEASVHPTAKAHAELQQTGKPIEEQVPGAVQPVPGATVILQPDDERATGQEK